MSCAPPKRRRGRALASVLLASLCAAGVIAPSAQAAQEEEGIALVDIRRVTMTWKQARRNVGVASTLCNISDRRAMGLKPRLEGFNFTRDEKPVSSKVLQLLDSDLKVLKRSPKLQAGLRAGDCLKIVVRVIPGTPIVDPGPFTGVLTVSSAGSGLARRELSLSGSATAETVAAKTPQKSPTLQATSDRPWKDDAHLDDPPELALLGKVPESAIAGTCGEKGDKSDASADEDAACPVIGVLVNDQERATLRVAGSLKPRVNDEGVTLLPLELEGADEVGVYEGVLDLGGTGKDEDAVAVTVKVTDSVWCALAALVIAFVVALLFQLFFRRCRPKRGLRKAAENLKSRYAKAKEEYAKHVPDELKAFRQPSAEADSYARDLKRALKRYRKTTVYLDTDSETWKNLRKSLDNACADIACWENADGLAMSLNGLLDGLTELRGFVAKRRFQDRTPALAETAATLLKPPGRELTVGEAIERAKQADALTPVLKRWQELAGSLLRYQAWWHGLRPKIDQSTDEEDEDTFLHAGAKLIEAKRELMQAKDAQALEHLETERDLALAHDELAYLGLKYEVPMPESNQIPDLAVKRDDAPTDVQLSALWPAQGELETVEEMIKNAGDWFVRAARVLKVYDVGGLFVDIAWIGLTIAAGVLAALATFYFDKEWGTWLDYLTVVVVGVAAQALLKTVVDALDQVLSSRASVLEAEPEPAKAAAAAQ